MKIAIAEAKAQFADLIRRAESGEEVELTRYGRPVARIVAAQTTQTRPLLGAMSGAFSVPDIHDGDREIAALFQHPEDP